MTSSDWRLKHQGGGIEVERLRQPGAQRLGQVGHLVPGGGALFVDPVEHLARAVGRLAGLGQAGGQRLERLAVDGRPGGREIHPVRKNTKAGQKSKAGSGGIAAVAVCTDHVGSRL